jgi:hypothetical protein
MNKSAFSVICTVALVLQVSAATYYIDYETGKDTNSGSDTLHPWKLCYGMKGSAVSPLPKGGDSLVFKGGVTWPRTTLPLFQDYMTPDSSKGNRIVYTSVDRWRKGAVWTRPVFDCEDSLIFKSGTTTQVAVVTFSYRNNVTFENIEIKNQGWSGGSGPLPAISLYSGANMVIRNCHIHDWMHYGDLDDKSGGIRLQQMTNCLIEKDTIKGPNTDGWGCGIYIVGTMTESKGLEIRNCKISYINNGILGCAGQNTSIHDNEICYQFNCSDPAEHENGLYIMGSTGKIYDNTLHHCYAAMVFYLGTPGHSNILAYNNYIHGCGPSTQLFTIDVDATMNPDLMDTFRLYNNTVVDTGGALMCFRIVGRSVTLNKLDLINNLFVGMGGIPVVSMENKITDLKCDHNCYVTSNASSFWRYTTTQTDLVGARQAHCDSNSIYLPSLALTGGGAINDKSPIVDAGVSLDGYFKTDYEKVTRPQINGWDIGAFEYEPAGKSISAFPVTTHPSMITKQKAIILIFDKIARNLKVWCAFYQLSGKRVADFTTTVSGDRCEVSYGSLPAGSYIAEIKYGGRRQLQQFAVQ